MRDKLNFHSKLFSRVNLGRYGKHDKIMDVDGVKGACMFMRREALEVAGNCDEKIFLQSEESDIAFRIHAAGWRVIYYPDAEIVHLWGSTTGRADSSSSGRLIIQKYQSNLYFYRKNRGILHSWIYKYCISIPLIVRVFILTISLPLTSKKNKMGVLREREIYLKTLRIFFDSKFNKLNPFTEVTYDYI